MSRLKGSKEGDALFLFSSRTDDVLSVELKGGKLGASCLKKHNTVKNVMLLKNVMTNDAMIFVMAALISHSDIL